MSKNRIIPEKAVFSVFFFFLLRTSNLTINKAHLNKALKVNCFMFIILMNSG